MQTREAVSGPAADQALVASFRFIFCFAVLCDILTRTNQVNKMPQSSSKLIDFTQSAKSFLSKHRHSGFAEAASAAKDLCSATPSTKNQSLSREGSETQMASSGPRDRESE